jgi:hypothetical protein
LRLTLSLPTEEAIAAMAATAEEAMAGTVATAEVIAVADTAAADMAAHTVATTVRVTGLAAAFRYRCLSLVAGKPAAQRSKGLKIGPAFAAAESWGQVD